MIYFISSCGDSLLFFLFLPTHFEENGLHLLHLSLGSYVQEAVTLGATYDGRDETKVSKNKLSEDFPLQILTLLADDVTIKRCFTVWIGVESIHVQDFPGR